MANRRWPTISKDWRHLHDGVEGIRFPPRWAENVMWVAIPLVPVAFLALMTWLPVYGALSMADQNRWNWVAPAIVALGISALVFALYSGLVAKGNRAEATRDVSHVLSDMDEMYRIGNPPADATAASVTEGSAPSAGIDDEGPEWMR